MISAPFLWHYGRYHQEIYHGDIETCGALHHASPQPAPSARTRVRRLPERAHYDADTIAAIVDAAMICTVAFQIDGAVHAIPTIHWREGDHLYIHGAKGSRMLKALTQGDACVTIALADGLVLARSALHHSMNYRSVVIYGRFEAGDRARVQARAACAPSSTGSTPAAGTRCARSATRNSTPPACCGSRSTRPRPRCATGASRTTRKICEWPVWAGVIPLRTTTGEPVAEADSVLQVVPPTRFG
jgi:nitroimidazol reductase NimA-like FMN-containing flavoprotein (pyridoxamine 5'-phosphate oxidase superfamily)